MLKSRTQLRLLILIFAQKEKQARKNNKNNNSETLTKQTFIIAPYKYSLLLTYNRFQLEKQRRED